MCDADGNTTGWAVKSLAYDARDRVTCIGLNASDRCAGGIQFGYDAAGNRLYESDGTDARIFLGDLFEWNTATSEAQLHIFAFGRRVATKMITNATLRPAAPSAAWPLPLPRSCSSSGSACRSWA